MRKIAIVLSLVVLAAAPAWAGADPVKVGPNIYKQIFENDKVRVSEVTFKPGDSIPPHSHNDHFVYVLENGKIDITKDGQTQTVDSQPGQVIWMSPETHSAVNNSPSDFKALVVELKPLPEYTE